MYVNVAKMAATANPLKAMEWMPEDGLTLHVVNLEAQMPMHFINSYEEGDFVYIDYVMYTDMSFISSFMIDDLLNVTKRNTLDQDCRIKRFAINIADKTVEVQEMPLTAGLERVNSLDMPSINPNFLYEPHCYVWGIALKGDEEHLSVNWLSKKNMCEPEKDRMWYKENHYPTEPVFIPAPDGKEEDEGVILSSIMDGEKGLSYLGVFDASTMELLSTSYLPFHIPTTLHGMFFN